MDLKTFLLARIAEDEAVARAAAGSVNEHASRYAAREYWFDEPLGATWQATGYGMVRGEHLDLWDCEGSETLCATPQAATHIAAHDPARVLAECAAKRAIIGSPADENVTRVQVGDSVHESTVPADQMERWSHGVGPNPDTLRALASVYAEHPEYQPEWAA